MAKRREKATDAERKAGAANLAAWREEHPAGGALRHGAWSKHVRRRYTDKRTREGRQLAAVMRGLTDDLGGNSNLTSAQRLLLDNIRSKLVVILQISKYVDNQKSIINNNGELLPCLGRNYTVYTESLRRDLEALFSIKRKPDSPSYEKAMRALQGGRA